MMVQDNQRRDANTRRCFVLPAERFRCHAARLG